MKTLILLIPFVCCFTSFSQIIFLGGGLNHTNSYDIDTLSYRNDTAFVVVSYTLNDTLQAIGNMVLMKGSTRNHGPYISFHSNGQLKSCGTFNMGKEVEPWLHWNKAGVAIAPAEISAKVRRGTTFYIDGVPFKND